MMPSTTVIMAIVLLSLGVVSLVLAYVGGRYSVTGAGRRAAGLVVLGAASLMATTLLMWDRDWSSVFDEMLWPLLVYIGAVAAGAGAGAGLIFLLVAAR
jgi:hypothetical protein